VLLIAPGGFIPRGDSVKPRFTPDQHAEMGRVLAGLHNELVHRQTLLLNAYPKSGPEAAPAKHLADAIAALAKARSALEGLHHAETPDIATSTTYWPHPEDRASVVY
jgi:Ser/Thr protein kinase RdoA (MazF antagonist)